MKKHTQKSENPYFYTDSNKRYFTYDYYLRDVFGTKVAKIPLDAGFTCPNIDGKCGIGGCIYCSGRGSGDFAESPLLPIEEQYEITRKKLSSKWDTGKCIPYFQAHTNTYAPLACLKEKFEEALAQEGIVGLNIATRPDCLPPDVLEYLAALSERTVLTVELGLQSSCDKTAARINRGHTFEQFVQGMEALRRIAPAASVCAHIILGLPDENEETMLRTVRDLAAMRPDQVKIHLLHVLKSTTLAEWYERGEYAPMERDAYVRLVADALELLPPETVIGRLTGDGSADDLLAPLWSRKKTTVINDIDKLLFSRNSYQGKYYAQGDITSAHENGGSL